MGNPIGRFFRFVIAPLRMQQGSLTCHCEPCAARRGNLAVPGWIMGKLPAKSQLPSRDSHVASLLGMTSRRCVSFEQWPVLIGSACRALSVTFGDSSPRGRAKVASLLGMTNLKAGAVGDGATKFIACMALPTRKGHAASVRRQSRQRLRSERRYRRNRCILFYRQPVRIGSAFPRLPRPLWGLAMTNLGALRLFTASSSNTGP